MALFKNLVRGSEDVDNTPKIPKKQEAWQKEEFQNKVLSWTRDKYIQCKSARQNFERQWYLNIAFYLGRQNVSHFPLSNNSAAGGNRLYTPPAPYWRSRPVINLIKPAIRTELSKLTSQKPTATIYPASSEDHDMYAAQAGEQIWESVYRDHKLDKKFRQALMWTLTTGNGFIKSYWDPNKQPKNVEQEGPNALGDFCFDAITPFHLYFPDMLCQDIEDQPYIIHISTRTEDWVRVNYPNLKMEANVVEASDLLNDSFLNLVGASNLRNNAVLCYEVWVKPNQVAFMPKGGMFTIIGDNLVQWAEGFQYGHGQYPFTHIGHIPANRFYHDSVILDLIPVQREYNRTRGQIQENKNKMGHIQIIAQKGSVEAAKITTEPGQVIEYKLGYTPPTPVAPAPLPNYVLQEVDRLRMDFEDISGQHDISKGQTPPGVTAATAISFLQEQDESMLSSTFRAIEEGWEKLGYQTLCYVKQYWDMPRIVKVTGTDGQFNAMVFKGSDIRSNTDLRIESGSALPTSKAAKQALLMDLMSQGFIPPEKGLELMDMGGVQRLYDEIKIDQAQASRENLRMAAVTQEMLSQYYLTFLPGPEQDPMAQMGADPMAAGGLMGTDVEAQLNQGDMEMMGAPVAEPQAPQSPFIDPKTNQPLVDASGMPTEPPLIVPVNSFDNHQVHIQVHNNFRKSQQFENLPQEIKDLFEQHVNQHMMAMGIIPGQPMPSGSMMDSGGMQNTPPEEQMPDGMMQQMMGGMPEQGMPQEQQGGVPNG